MLSKDQRLCKKKDFDSVFNKKCSVSVPTIVCYVKPVSLNKPLQSTQVGFVVGKKVHKQATKRNKIKRRMREAYRSLKKDFPELSNTFDGIIFIARPAVQEKSFIEIHQDIYNCLKRAHKLVSKKYVKKNSNNFNKNIPES